MPYYIYAIDTDSGVNRLCGSFANYHRAEICERDDQRGNDSEDMIMIYAENKNHALQRIRQKLRGKGPLRN
jgi:hypothetical protein